MTLPSDPSTDPELAALWVGLLARAADGSAHGFKNQLNAVAVNLEVARARTARGGDAAPAAPFAATAANEFERVATVADALLALARAEREPCDVGIVLARLVTLFGAAGEASEVVVRRADESPTVTGAPGLAVRAAVACVLQSALARGGRVTCELGGEGGIFLRLTGAPERVPHPDEPVAALLARHGIGVRSTESSVDLLFPAPGR